MVPSRAKIVVAYATVYLVWGSTYLAIRGALVSLPPFGMAGTRFMIAGSVLYAIGLLRGGSWPTLRQGRDATLVGAMLMLCGNGSVVLAERTLSSGVAALLIATEPLSLVLLVWALPGGRRPSLRATVGILVGLAGVVVLVASHSGFAHERVDLGGAALVVLGSVAWAAGSLYGSRIPVAARLPSLQSSGATLFMGGALMMIASVLHGEPVPHDVTFIAWFSWGYLVVLGSIVTFSAYAWLVTVEPPERVATYAFVNPVIAVLVGWLLADEPVGPGILGAAALITAGVVLLVLPRKRSGAQR